MNKLKIGLVIVGILIIGSIIMYVSMFTKVSSSDEEIGVVIPLGTGTNGIADILKENSIIRSKLGFKIYVKVNNIDNFKAGEYSLKQNMSLKEITESLQSGIVYDQNYINFTYLEGKNMRWLAKKIAETTNNPESEVYELLSRENYINSLIEKYWFITDEIKNEDIYYSLEGYLFPDTYALKNEDVSVEEIFEKMLDKMEEVLEEYRDEIDESELNVHEILTLASIVEMESVHTEDRKDVASVVYNRLDRGMAIQSDVTTYYAFKIDMGERDLYQKELDTYNPYNTRGPNMEGKLPVGPISSVSKTSIEAAINPNKTNYLFFVADKNGKVYFSKTSSEHNHIISELRTKGLWFEY
ncbi:MAG: endolytic transglycosylase MltG [Clostridia bacterium]|nr:endolytic transglycosylase MltG [Clostridia bacterium]